MKILTLIMLITFFIGFGIFFSNGVLALINGYKDKELHSAYMPPKLVAISGLITIIAFIVLITLILKQEIDIENAEALMP